MRRGNDAVHARFARPPRRRRLAGRAAPLRRRHGDPRRRLRVHLRRHAHARHARRRARRLRRAARRAVRRPVARPRRHRRREHRRRARATASRVYKSGKYTVERPLHLGAALAGRLDRARAPLSAIGLPLGRGVPAPRRRARRVRRRRGHRQAGRRRPARGQAHAAGRARVRARRRRRPRAARRGSAPPTLAPPTSPRCRTLFVRTGALDEIEADIERLVAEARDALGDGADRPTPRAPGSTSSPPTSPGGTDSRRHPAADS